MTSRLVRVATLSCAELGPDTGSHHKSSSGTSYLAVNGRRRSVRRIMPFIESVAPRDGRPGTPKLGPGGIICQGWFLKIVSCFELYEAQHYPKLSI